METILYSKVLVPAGETEDGETPEILRLHEITLNNHPAFLLEFDGTQCGTILLEAGFDRNKMLEKAVGWGKKLENSIMEVAPGDREGGLQNSGRKVLKMVDIYKLTMGAMPLTY